jgi:uncharacterized protein YndB with AHSA1/START domain
MAESKSTKEPELVIARIFDAPRELVFKAWTEPEHVKQWWGPRNFTAPYIAIDFCVGGSFHFCMRGPDGKDYWNKGVYQEIVVPERIVSVMYFSDSDGNVRKPTDYGIGPDFPTEMHDVVTFEIHDRERTKLTLHRRTPLAVSKRYGEDQGWNQSLDRFAEALRAMRSA